MEAAGKKTCNYRAHCRDNHEASIRYSNLNAVDYHEAKMYNISDSGMYFESEHNGVHRGSEIFIKVPENRDVYTRDGYRAEVMWCREIPKDGAGACYGIGVRFVVNRCDHCGEKFPHREIHKTDNFLFLCSDCLRRLENLPGGKLKGSVENYLMGNVI
ncbi:PilZ domain-containing protein [Desulfococcaceae bacterium HSG8]|nr:PilZ domain-containing protein [Desulfococcaceae bacterium HSG8]